MLVDSSQQQFIVKNTKRKSLNRKQVHGPTKDTLFDMTIQSLYAAYTCEPEQSTRKREWSSTLKTGIAKMGNLYRDAWILHIT